ncbi:VOC family protein [Microbacterium sp. P05]|uniref:VOC family protein n=1 Tax=Microbacterium sp. P05 TaxID=3366948 RepID=UPI00374741B8
MIALDHIAVWSDNLYRTTIDLAEQTGIGSIDGGYFPGLGLGQKLMSLGGSVYVEVESIVDHQMIANGHPMAKELAKQTFGGDCFAGLCLRSDEVPEIEAFARHLGIEPSRVIDGGKRSMILGQRGGGAFHAPDFRNSWLRGKPNVYLGYRWDDDSSGLDPQPGSGRVRGQGVTAIEVGGTEAEMRAWLGPLDLDQLDLEIHFNGKADGLYAVAFNSTAGPQTLRLNPITL